MDDAKIEDFIDLNNCPLNSLGFANRCSRKFNREGVLTIPDFLNKKCLKELIDEGKHNQHKAYYTSSTHNVYLTPKNQDLGNNHIFNRQVKSTKGCITTDQIPDNSGLKVIYHSRAFKKFLSKVMSEKELYAYEDPFSSINVHYAGKDQELGWHFDNSNFAVTLLLQKPEYGGDFEYVKDVRKSEEKDMGYDKVKEILDGKVKPCILSLKPGTLVLFRGKNSIHRVTPTKGDLTRILVVFAYNARPGVSLSESAQKTFYGKVSKN